MWNSLILYAVHFKPTDALLHHTHLRCYSETIEVPLVENCIYGDDSVFYASPFWFSMLDQNRLCSYYWKEQYHKHWESHLIFLKVLLRSNNKYLLVGSQHPPQQLHIYTLHCSSLSQMISACVYSTNLPLFHHAAISCIKENQLPLLWLTAAHNVRYQQDQFPPPHPISFSVCLLHVEFSHFFSWLLYGQLREASPVLFPHPLFTCEATRFVLDIWVDASTSWGWGLY